MSKPSPSPYDVTYRWPRAVTAVSALISWGDIKHGDDGRPDGRGFQIDNDRYDHAYSMEKLHRHDVRFAGGQTYDEENGHPHPVAVAWHALNALEAFLKARDYSVEDIIEQYHVYQTDEVDPW